MGFLLFNGKLVTGEGVTEAAIFIDGEKIAKIVKADRLEKDFLSKYSSFRAIDLQGKFVFAGGIDAHVHFREPGMTSKADIGTESRAAVKGGVTSFIDMPNTKPAAVSALELADKLDGGERILIPRALKGNENIVPVLEDIRRHNVFAVHCDLDIISRLQLGIPHVVIFHVHKGGVRICFTIIIPSLKAGTMPVIDRLTL